MNMESVGKFFIKDGEIWQCISYCEPPTFCFENLKTKERMRGIEQSLQFKDLKELTIKEAENEN